jgi:hypothetical protein
MTAPTIPLHRFDALKISFLSAATALAMMSVAGAAEKAPGEPPVQFLRTDIPACRRGLATEITADFHGATIREVIDDVGRKSHANIILSLNADGSPKGAPKITRRFQRVPLRTVLYQLSLDTGLTIDWVFDEKNIPFAIRIRNQ